MLPAYLSAIVSALYEIVLLLCAVCVNVNALVLNCFPICDDKFVLTYPFSLLMQVHAPNAVKPQSLEWRKVYCLHSRRQGCTCPKNPQTPWRVSVIHFKSLGGGEWGHRICDQVRHHSLIDSWWGNKVVSQGLTLSVLRLQEARTNMLSWSSST